MHWHNLVPLAVTPLWLVAGRVAARARLPSLTGYVAAGCAAGPSAIGLFLPEDIVALRVVSHICLSLIAIAAGAELQLKELRLTTRQVLAQTAGICICSFSIVYLSILGLASDVAYLKDETFSSMARFAAFAATISMSRSPASAIVVLREEGGKGPFCQLAMNIVVVKDIVVFITFAVIMEVARLDSRPPSLDLSHTDNTNPLLHMLLPLMSVIGAVGLGALAGVVLGLILNTYPSSPRKTTNRMTRRLREGFFVTIPLVGSIIVYFAAEAMHAEPLLACVTVGAVAANLASKTAYVLSSSLTMLLPIINVVFFGLTGASLKLGALHNSFFLAALLFAVRLLAIWTGCILGNAISELPEQNQRLLPYSMITQAGIALGLASVVGNRFHDSWGPDFAALQTTIVMANLLIGPSAFRYAIQSAGEAGRVVREASPQMFEVVPHEPETRQPMIPVIELPIM